eukprot:gene15826-biopygen3703
MPDSMGFVLSKDGQKGQPSGPHAAAAACRAAEAACRAAEAACRAAEAACRAAEAACRAAEVACRAAEAACRAAEAACRAAEAACRAAEAASDAEDAAAGKFKWKCVYVSGNIVLTWWKAVESLAPDRPRESHLSKLFLVQMRVQRKSKSITHP